VIWLSSPQQEGWEINMVNMKYGNEASLMWHYSHAAILIDIPPRRERNVLAEAGVVEFPDWHEEGRGKASRGKRIEERRLKRWF
jgi:hypothetical protein